MSDIVAIKQVTYKLLKCFYGRLSVIDQNKYKFKHIEDLYLKYLMLDNDFWYVLKYKYLPESININSCININKTLQQIIYETDTFLEDIFDNMQI